MEEPGFVRLFRVRDGAQMGASQVVDFFGGGNAGVLWLMRRTGEVAVGRDIVFTHVPPLTADGAKLPIEHETKAQDRAIELR